MKFYNRKIKGKGRRLDKVQNNVPPKKQKAQTSKTDMPSGCGQGPHGSTRAFNSFICKFPQHKLRMGGTPKPKTPPFTKRRLSVLFKINGTYSNDNMLSQNSRIVNTPRENILNKLRRYARNSPVKYQSAKK